MPIYVVIWIHLVAAVTLMGGLIFFNFVLKPGLQEVKSEPEKLEILRKVGQRFRTVTWICLITLILTGAFNMLYEGGSARIETTWGVILMLKLFLFAITFGLILIHDFVLDPYASSSRNPGKSTNVSPYAGRAQLLQQAILLLTLIILLIASYLSAM